MSPSSPSAQETARKSHATVLRALQAPGRQVAIATAMGVSESTVSRLKTEHLAQICALLAHAGLKVVPAEDLSVDPTAVQALWFFARGAFDGPEALRLPASPGSAGTRRNPARTRWALPPMRRGARHTHCAPPRNLAQ